MSADLSEAESRRILDECPKVLATHGVFNHTRGAFARLVGENVVGSSNPLFSSMQPKIKLKAEREWVIAYSIALSYLRDRCPETVSALHMEFANSSNGLQEPVIETPPISFDALLAVQPNDFGENVERFRASLSTAQPVDDDGTDAFLTAPTTRVSSCNRSGSIQNPISDDDQD
jgi:hypothetical protein